MCYEEIRGKHVAKSIISSSILLLLATVTITWKEVISLRKNNGNNKIDKAVEDFIVMPVIVLVGIYVVSALIDSMLQINSSTFRVIFTGVGGIPFFVYYFKKKLSKL